jgi:hypothetical protein
MQRRDTDVDVAEELPSVGRELERLYAIRTWSSADEAAYAEVCHRELTLMTRLRREVRPA